MSKIKSHNLLQRDVVSAGTLEIIEIAAKEASLYFVKTKLNNIFTK